MPSKPLKTLRKGLDKFTENIEALLNPEGEFQVLTMTETSDREIYQAVMDAIEACDNMEINSGDDIELDGSIFSEALTLVQLIVMHSRQYQPVA